MSPHISPYLPKNPHISLQGELTAALRRFLTQLHEAGAAADAVSPPCREIWGEGRYGAAADAASCLPWSLTLMLTLTLTLTLILTLTLALAQTR